MAGGLNAHGGQRPCQQIILNPRQNKPNYNLLALDGSAESSRVASTAGVSITALLTQLGSNPQKLVKVEALANARRYMLYKTIGKTSYRERLSAGKQ